MVENKRADASVALREINSTRELERRSIEVLDDSFG
jgi:hypothetical protein